MATPLVTEQAIDRLIQAGLDEPHVDCNQQLANRRKRLPRIGGSASRRRRMDDGPRSQRHQDGSHGRVLSRGGRERCS